MILGSLVLCAMVAVYYLWRGICLANLLETGEENIFLSSTSFYKKEEHLVLVVYGREPCMAEEACITEPPVIVITCFWLML